MVLLNAAINVVDCGLSFIDFEFCLMINNDYGLLVYRKNTAFAWRGARFDSVAVRHPTLTGVDSVRDYCRYGRIRSKYWIEE